MDGTAPHPGPRGTVPGRHTLARVSGKAEVALTLPSLPDRLRASLPDAVLLGFALVQLWPFLAAFHQSADDNFSQLSALLALDNPWSLIGEIRGLAERQGRIGIYPTMPLEYLGAMLGDYAWGRVLAVLLFGLVILGLCRLLARHFRLPLTRPALLLTLCLTPMAAHHLPPNAYPLLITVPLLGLIGIHLWLARERALHPWKRAGAAVALTALMLLLEYAFLAGLALAAIAVLAAGSGRRLRVLCLHGPAVLAAAALYLSYRALFPSTYGGNIAQLPSPLDILSLQMLHGANGTIFPHLAPASPGRTDLVIAASVLLAGAWLAARLLPALARVLRPAAALGLLAAGLGWAWVNTIAHALTAKYQAWCRLGDCTYVDSRVAVLALGAVAAVVIAALLRRLSRAGGSARAATLACAAAVGLLGAATFLQNRASAREMAGRERALAVLRGAACEPESDVTRSPAVMRSLSRTIAWHLPPAPVPPAEVYLAAYRARMERLGLACRPMPFAPKPWPVEFIGWTREPEGRWSLGDAGVLLLTGGAGTTGMVLTLGTYVPPGGEPRRVGARAAGGVACDFRIGTSPREVFLPWQGAEGARELILALETPDAVSPSTVGDTEDPRTLGVFLSSARLARPGEPPANTALNLRRCAEAG
ncbi:hypothetical protein [Roseomonas sp. WA12]